MSSNDFLYDLELPRHVDVLRDDFAMTALNGLLANPTAFALDDPCAVRQFIAHQCYLIADAMIEARGKTNDPR
jgi:hypothetical protein